ncbi:MAG: prepilin-type N-terminal cleavage/methylation domain-containing protein [Pirellulaceae bacterium]
MGPPVQMLIGIQRGGELSQLRFDSFEQLFAFHVPACVQPPACFLMFAARPNRRAFTLLELLLSIAVLAAITAVALPNIAMVLGDRRLVRGADMLRIEMTELRLESMREGRVMMLDAMLEEGTLRIRPYFSMADAVEATDMTGSQSAMLSGADSGTMVAVPVDEQANKEIELPEEIIVQTVAVVSAARAMEIQQQTAGDQASGYSQPILFYPDGTTSNAAVILAHPTLGNITVKLRGITGEVNIGKVEAPQ